MLIVNIQDAKTRLAELIARAVNGEPFIISKAGKPMVRVEAVEPEKRPASDTKAMETVEVQSPKWGIGSLKGQFTVPDDFDTMASDEIEAMFYGKS